MKTGLLLLAVSLSTWAPLHIQAQGTPQTYALVVGISTYENTGIPSLQFAHRDAAFFAEYLQSQAGGSVPLANIELLLNEKATYSAIYDGMYSLLGKARSGDRVYFYFSGHGDVETKIIESPGFLLASNTSPNNYMNRAVRLEDINTFTRTLSTINEATVILITDACRSGKLAGDGLNGRQVIGRQLQQVQENEVRLASCQPHELSAEGPAWGGGRGAFSYYLLKELQNTENANTNGQITFAALKKKMPDLLARDLVLLRTPHQQTPVLSGPDDVVFANTGSMIAARSSLLPAPAAKAQLPGSLSNVAPLTSREIKGGTVAHFFKVHGSALPGVAAAYKDWAANTNHEVPALMVRRVMEKVDSSAARALQPLAEKLQQQSSPEWIQFARDLTNFACNLGSENINAYLKSDTAELEKRAYYSNVEQHFQPLIQLYNIALQLIPEQHFLYNPMRTDRYYFAALAERLSARIAGTDSNERIQQALANLREAMAIEPYAAYIHNEMGIALFETGKLDSAEWHYNMAAALSPTWALPLSNLAGLQISRNQLTKATRTVEQAKKLDPNLQLLWAQEATLAEKTNNLLLAENLYSRLLRRNLKNFYPYERLAIVRLPEMRYREADSLLNEAAWRKKGYYIPEDNPTRMSRPPGNPISASIIMEAPPPCEPLRPLKANSHPALYFLAGWEKYNANDQANAQKIWEQGLQRYPADGYLNHYYAQLLYNSGQKMNAIPFLQKAISNHTDIVTLITQWRNRDTGWKQEIAEPCLLYAMKKRSFPIDEDMYLLASIYDENNFIEDAAAIYHTLTQPAYFHHHFSAAWLLWAQMLQRANKFAEAEQVLTNYHEQCMAYHHSGKYIVSPYNEICKMVVTHGLYELDYLYENVCKRYPNESNWHQRAANHWWDRLMKAPLEYYENSMEREDGFSYLENFYIRSLSSLSNDLTNIPGSKNNNLYAYPMTRPWKRGINMLQRAIELASTTESAAALYKKNSQLLWEVELPDEALNQLEVALYLLPGNHSLRNELAYRLYEAGEVNAARLQWDTLQTLDKLLPIDRLRFLLLTIKEGNAQKASPLLSQYARFFHIDKDSLRHLELLFFLYQKDYTAALKLLSTQPFQYPDPIRYYVMALCHGGMQQPIRCQQNLRLALQAGWNYRLVIEHQPEFNFIRQRAPFQVLMQLYAEQFLKYPELAEKEGAISAPELFHGK